MIDTSNYQYYGRAEKLVDILVDKTQNPNPMFFRILVSYHLTKVASMMRCNIDTKIKGSIPVNMYAINLASSGQGKGYSTNIIEESVLNRFRTQFLESSFPNFAEVNLESIAMTRSAKSGTDEQEELEKVQREFSNAGAMAFSFDSGTTAAVKQMRHKLLLANAGSVNMEIDEIGSNLMGNSEVLNAFLELFDVGKIKQKLTKNTKENIRNEEIDGKTPTNMMLFGTPAKLLNGSKTEDEFYSMLETGYARRCIFGYNRDTVQATPLSAAEMFDKYTDTSNDTYLLDLSTHLEKLAASVNFNKTIPMSKAVAMEMIEYMKDCTERANEMAEHEEIRKAELTHRYFKAAKLAGTYAFIDESPEVTIDHLHNAIKLVEDSGQSLDKILTRDKNYVRLAKYITSSGKELTHADLTEDLPFYKGGEHMRRELMSMAIAYGYKNNMVIHKKHMEDVEVFTGESLAETDLNECIVSYSTDYTTGYQNAKVKFKDLHTLTQQPNYHWVAHHLRPNDV